jgi:hypothetical protein
MEKIAVFVNDAEHARHLLQPMLGHGRPAHWIVVACAPTLTRHIGRWVSHAARQQWLERWSTELFAQLEPDLRAIPGSRVEKLLARRPLAEVCQRLETRQGPLRLLDARRPRVGRPDEPLTAQQPPTDRQGWAYPVAATTGLTALLALAD